MSIFLGEYPCTIDERGRLKLPEKLLKRMPEADKGQFVIARSLDKCLLIYSVSEWKKIEKKMMKVSAFTKKGRALLRRLLGGATEIDIDSSNRIIIPKQLIEYAMIKKDILISPYKGGYEMWDEKLFKEQIEKEEESDNISDLAEELLGNIDDDE